jgi:hypothetical protein
MGITDENFVLGELELGEFEGLDVGGLLVLCRGEGAKEQKGRADHGKNTGMNNGNLMHLLSILREVRTITGKPGAVGDWPEPGT